MTDSEKDQLTHERDAIQARIAAASSPADTARAKQDLGERLQHLEARLAAPPDPTT